MSSIYLHADLLDAMPRDSTQRRRIMEFVRGLGSAPDTPGDFTDRDPTDRIRQIKIIGDHAITYWHDSPVNNVMVVDIRRADR